jgi:hypothetical protein
MNIQNYEYKRKKLLLECSQIEVVNKNDQIFLTNQYKIKIDRKQEIPTSKLIWEICYQPFFQKIIFNFEINKTYQLDLNMIVYKENQAIIALFNPNNDEFIALGKESWEEIKNIQFYLQLNHELMLKNKKNKIKL